MPTLTCPLCFSDSTSSFHCDKLRTYLRCQTCSLVFVPPQQHLSPTQEQAIYDLHQNQVDDQGYRRFLSRFATPLLQQLEPQSSGLDYGCGPGPLLAQMLGEQGHQMTLYDPFYAPDNSYRQQRYDFISCSEVAEHFRLPGQEFEHLFELLKPQGILALMTKLVIDATAFATWHYKNDPTHISFYCRDTLHWLANHYRTQLTIIGNDVILFTKH